MCTKEGTMGSGARNQIGIGLPYRPARLYTLLHSLAEFRFLESILGLIKSLKIRAQVSTTHALKLIELPLTLSGRSLVTL